MIINTEQEVFPNYNSIKIAIWLYFFLWIFEGALRKWILPSLATPLLVVRDPIAIYIILRVFYLNIKFINPYVVISLIFTLLSLAITLTFGHGNLFVGLYGARIMLIHFPLIFIIGAVFTKDDILKMGRAFLGINILVTLIVYFQYISPQSAFVNIGIGGEGSAGFAGSMGYFRPSGTFSFISGLANFYTGVSVFVFYFWLSKDSCSKILLYISTIALVVGLPLTISRGAVAAVIIVGLFAIIASVTTGKQVFRLIFISVVFCFVIFILQKYLTIFNVGTEVFLDRVESANLQAGSGGLKDSILLRALNETFGPIGDLLSQPLFSGNLGMGTNAGAQMLTGKTNFMISEMESGRLIGEQGVIFGGGLIFLRMLFAIRLAIKSFKLPQEAKLLPFIICGAACITLFLGQWAQPSILGYAIIISGLVIASFKKDVSPLKSI
ncbi:hypothetical protein LNP27_11020 [Flavobacterium galactosidilyticum]|uniref:hypothetical protein n=1 Tax=Flavobacterium galactosidilyticum TaxID=2893886 RepID=UPI001E3B248A|nr:hypothetical protein [Flavobacterium sp. F-340]UFH45652.1 hypothetical protein LNP27_11020 [Flavobacterium sp. F-340]